MLITIESVKKQYTSCNFCSKGEYLQGIGVIRPYDEVFTFCNDSKNGIKASICKDCLNELFNSINK